MGFGAIQFVDGIKDCDQLENLDFLFDVVRSSTKSIVVVLTPELLKRVWCAGEIVAWPTFSVVGRSGGNFESAKKHETF